MSRLPQWKAPQTDGARLTWEAPDTIVEQTLQNHARLRNDRQTIIQNTPLADLRTGAREYVGKSVDQPLIATGHQIELSHPGVWAKNIVINLIAQRTQGSAMHIAVDTDSPKHLDLRWPGSGPLPMTDQADVNPADWSGATLSPTPAHLRHLISSYNAAAAQWDFQPLMPEFFESVRSHLMDEPFLSPLILRATHELDWSLGMRHDALTLSPMLDSDAYLSLVMHICSDIENFARHYNEALAEYRRIARIRSATRPMPDLEIGADRIELPFWIDDLSTGQRVRAYANRSPNGWTLGCRDRLVFDGKLSAADAACKLRLFLRSTAQRLSPRALTLTMFFRLLLVDQFIHGIGGGQYDQVTDRIIRTYFELEPPAFSVTTATMYFPGAGEPPRICVPCLVSEGHKLRHDLLGPQKDSFLQTISSAPRRSIERKTTYLAMHRALQGAASTTDQLPQWKSRLETALATQARNKVTFDRELFYALQTRERLIHMIERYSTEFSCNLPSPPTPSPASA